MESLLTETEVPVRDKPAVPTYPELLEAANIIRKRGLAHGETCDQKGRVCLMGAYMVATGSGPFPEGLPMDWTPALDALGRACGAQPPRTNQHLQDRLYEVRGYIWWRNDGIRRDSDGYVDRSTHRYQLDTDAAIELLERAAYDA